VVVQGSNDVVGVQVLNEMEVVRVLNDEVVVQVLFMVVVLQMVVQMLFCPGRFAPVLLIYFRLIFVFNIIINNSFQKFYFLLLRYFTRIFEKYMLLDNIKSEILQRISLIGL
jgi:hypothetical protein